MLTLDLSAGAWTFAEAGSHDWRDAVVPGCVHTDLHRHGLIPDPFRGANELDLQWIEERDWLYRCRFAANPALLAAEHVELVFDGLDTVATVTLNGAEVLCADNMFHRFRVDVRDVLLADDNELLVHFTSAMTRIRATAGEFEPPATFNDPVGGCVRLRKQQSQFGWDWGPRFVTAGVWRRVRIEAWGGNRLDSVRIEQLHGDGTVALRLHPMLAVADPAAAYRWSLSLAGVPVVAGGGTEAVVPSPQLWWPTGHGAQPLYDLTVEHVGSGSRWIGRIGLRSIALDMAADGAAVTNENGRPLGRMGFRVNGRLIFAKGANWIPAHSFVAGLTRDDYAPLVQAAADANMNTLRIWGGGIYEHDAFYDLCDEHGLLVWQDLMFAVDLYPASDAFLASVAREVADQAQRIRHHPCLSLWCGNNEIAWHNQGAFKEQRYADGYERLFLGTIPDALATADPATPYIHSSPLMGLPGRPQHDAPSEDAHDWKVWHDRFPVSHYETTRYRLLSEFGMQSYPSLEVARTFCPPEELNVFSPVFDNHQKNRGGNLVILDYVARLYRFPRDYDALAYLSQLNQGHCMQVAIEHCRRLSPVCLGTLYWQLNDCWPVASWSSLEFGGRWKALHYTARRIFAPTLLSIRQLGEEKRIVGNYVRSDTGPVEIHAVHDGPDPLAATLRWRLVDLAGAVLAQGKTEVTLAPLEARLLSAPDLTAAVVQAGRDRVYLRAELCDATGAEIAAATSFFAPPRALALTDAPIVVEQAGDALTLRSDGFHFAVEVRDAGAQAWSDNFFHLHPGEARRITPLRPTGDPLPPLRVRSLVHSQARDT